ncbi:MAG: alpha/beta hydrolase [Myxococcales bacterium]|nr:alpha/beta hydrolase [Myxococcales bacterium]
MATFALVPGGGGDPWEWHRLVPELQRRGHTAIAVRLPSDDDSAGWPEYAAAVVSAVGGCSDLVVVAASMGAFTAPLVCERRSVDLLVLLNAMIPRHGESFGEWWSATGSRDARRRYHASLGLPAAAAEDDAVMYYHDFSQHLLEEALSRPQPTQSSTPLGEPWPLQAWPDVPTRVLAGRHDRLFPLAFQRRLARERLGLEVDEIDGGHALALSHAGALAERLDGYVRGLS